MCIEHPLDKLHIQRAIIHEEDGGPGVIRDLFTVRRIVAKMCWISQYNYTRKNNAFPVYGNTSRVMYNGTVYQQMLHELSFCISLSL